MAVGDGDAAEHCTDDTEEPLIGAAEEEVSERSETVDKLLGCPVDAAVVVAGETADGSRSEDVRVDHVGSKIGQVLESTFDDAFIPVQLAADVLVFGKVHPIVRIGESGDADASILERLGVVEVIGRADDTAAEVDGYFGAFVVEIGGIVVEDDGIAVAE